jgi:hypothetical protein
MGSCCEESNDDQIPSLCVWLKVSRVMSRCLRVVSEGRLTLTETFAAKLVKAGVGALRADRPQRSETRTHKPSRWADPTDTAVPIEHDSRPNRRNLHSVTFHSLLLYPSCICLPHLHATVAFARSGDQRCKAVCRGGFRIVIFNSWWFRGGKFP